MPFYIARANNAFLNRACPIGERMLCVSRVPSRAKNALCVARSLSGRECSVCRACPTGPKMLSALRLPYWIENSLCVTQTTMNNRRSCKQQSVKTGDVGSLFLFFPCSLALINRLNSATKKVCHAFRPWLLRVLETERLSRSNIRLFFTEDWSARHCYYIRIRSILELDMYVRVPYLWFYFRSIVGIRTAWGYLVSFEINFVSMVRASLPSIPSTERTNSEKCFRWSLQWLPCLSFLIVSHRPRSSAIGSHF